jgi:hypothetical protein
MEAMIKAFEGQEVTFRRSGDRWGMTAEELGAALGYKNARKSMNNLIAEHRDELAPFLSDTETVTEAGKRRVTVIMDQGIMLAAMFARTERAAAFRLWVATLLVELQGGSKAVVEAELLAEIRALRAQNAAPIDPKVMILNSIAANLPSLSPAVQKIVVTTALALPAEKSTTWNATAISEDLNALGVVASAQKVGKVAIAHGVKCPKVEQENEYGFWSTTSVNNYSKVVDCFLYNKAGRDRLIAILAAANAGQAVG